MFVLYYLIYTYIYNDTSNVLNHLQNTAYWIVINKTLNETAKGTLFLLD